MSFLELNHTKPVWLEGFVAIAIGLGFVASLTATDISFHDDYVLLVLSWCHADNQDAFCTDFREKHGLDPDEQIDIGKKYWNRLAGQAIELFFLLFGVRMLFAFYLHVSHVRRIRPTTFVMAIIWGASASTIFMFGFLDTMYYLFQDEPIPEQLQWLDGAGVFQETKMWFGDPTHVEKEDLFATNAVGFGIIALLILFNMALFQHLGYKNRGIA